MRKKIWNFWASKYEKLWAQKYSLMPTRKTVTNLIQEYSLKSQNRFLDVGCGTGQLIYELYQNFYERDPMFCGIDFSEDMISIGKKDLPFAKLFCMDVSEINKLPYKFDIITCTHSIPYYQNQAKAISDMADKLSDDGILILAHGSKNSIYDNLALSIISLSTGKANYLSVYDVLNICDKRLKIVKMLKLDTERFVPTILITVLKRKK